MTAPPAQFRRRSDWENAAQRIGGPAPRQATTLPVCHYTAAPSGINGNTAEALRAMQNDYLTSRGYSLGYWYLVDRAGVAWQIRGPHPADPVKYNAAANPGRLVNGNANDWTAPILFPHGIDEPIPQAAIDTAVALWRWLGLHGRPVPHSALDPTGCCGDAARVQIAMGLLDIVDMPPDPPPFDPGADMIRYTVDTRQGQFLIGGGMPVLLSAAMASSLSHVPKIVGSGRDEETRWDEYMAIYQAAQR